MQWACVCDVVAESRSRICFLRHLGQHVGISAHKETQRAVSVPLLRQPHNREPLRPAEARGPRRGIRGMRRTTAASSRAGRVVTGTRSARGREDIITARVPRQRQLQWPKAMRPQSRTTVVIGAEALAARPRSPNVKTHTKLWFTCRIASSLTNRQAP